MEQVLCCVKKPETDGYEKYRSPKLDH